MTDTEDTQPAEWRERAEGGRFEGWFVPSSSEMFSAVVLAVVLTAPAVMYRLAFAEQYARGGVYLVTPAIWALLALPAWCRVVLLPFPLARFRIADGRLVLRTRAVPVIGSVSLPLGDVRAVRPDPRTITGKRRSYDVWDVVVDTRDGASQRVRLSLDGRHQASWIARRVAAIAGVTA